jgi:hypothetical protein
MVEDRTTDANRVAELLASELTGLETGPLADVSVVDADPDATPSPGGTEAYAVECRERRVGEVALLPDGVRVRLTADAGGETAGTAGRVPVEPTDGGSVLHVESGTAVKPAVDVIRAALE